MKGRILWIANRNGQTMVEYVLLLSLLAMAAFVAVSALGTSVQNMLYNPASRAIP